MKNQKMLVSVIGIIGLMALSLWVKRLRHKHTLSAYDVATKYSEEDGLMIIKKCSFYDLTSNITEDTIVFPGDPVFQKKTVSSIKDGCCFNLCKIEMGNHMGTHIDFPAHVIESGKTSSDYSINDLIGNGLIIEVPTTADSITTSFVSQQEIQKNDFVFFKTKKSNFSNTTGFSEKFVFIKPDAVKLLLEKKVRIVGIDSISVDSYYSENLPVHHLLLSNDVLIVENLELNGIEPGRCRLIIAPLQISNMDGLPARVFMSRR